jgi:hypothetical protein
MRYPERSVRDAGQIAGPPANGAAVDPDDGTGRQERDAFINCMIKLHIPHDTPNVRNVMDYFLKRNELHSGREK